MKKNIYIFILILFPLYINAQCWSKVSTGGAHTMGIGSDGSLWTWGRGNTGQLGSGSFTNSNIPLKVGVDLNWQKISAGNAHSVALKSNGTIWSWGRNTLGQLGNGLAGNVSIPTQIGTNSNWTYISAGYEYTTAIKTDGTLWAWGDNTYGQLGDGTFGTANNKATPVQIGTDTNWLMVSAASGHTMAIKTNGTLWGWGRNNYSQLGDATIVDKYVPTQIGLATNWQNVEGALYFTIAMKATGTIWTWGHNDTGQLGDNTLVDKITPTNIEPTNTYSKITKGEQYSFVQKADGTLWAFGGNALGQLGDGTLINKLIPTAVSTSATTWQQIISKFYHCAAIKSDGTLYTWGKNLYGEMGDGTGISKSLPTLIVCPTLANDQFEISNFSIYPNPAPSVLNISWNENSALTKIKITDISGKIVLEQFENLSSINIENLSNGLYIIQLFSESNVYQSKFIKN
jgi:alpha-tubulin suppressor-like RCC1 family protein